MGASAEVCRALWRRSTRSAVASSSSVHRQMGAAVNAAAGRSLGRAVDAAVNERAVGGGEAVSDDDALGAGPSAWSLAGVVRGALACDWMRRSTTTRGPLTHRHAASDVPRGWTVVPPSPSGRSFVFSSSSSSSSSSVYPKTTSRGVCWVSHSGRSGWKASFIHSLAAGRRSYFAGHAQIRNAEGQDRAQVRAGVRLRKALCAVLTSPSMHHRFEGTGLVILEVRMAADFKLAHVLWTTASLEGENADGGDAVARAKHALTTNATRLRNMTSRLLRAKHTPRLEFVHDGRRSDAELDLAATFARVAEEEAARAKHMEYLAAVEQKTAALRAAGLYVPGRYEREEAAGEARMAARKLEAAEAATEAPRGHAYETFDGGAYETFDGGEYFEPEYDDEEEEDEDEDDRGKRSGRVGLASDEAVHESDSWRWQRSTRSQKIERLERWAAEHDAAKDLDDGDLRAIIAKLYGDGGDERAEAEAETETETTTGVGDGVNRHGSGVQVWRKHAAAIGTDETDDWEDFDVEHMDLVDDSDFACEAHEEKEDDAAK